MMLIQVMHTKEVMVLKEMCLRTIMCLMAKFPSRINADGCPCQGDDLKYMPYFLEFMDFKTCVRRY